MPAESPPPLASTVTSGDSQSEETPTDSPPPPKRLKLTSSEHDSQEKESKVPQINYSDLEFGDAVGEGGFSIVYKGHWQSRNMDVAIKRMPGKLHKGEVRYL